MCFPKEEGYSKTFNKILFFSDYINNITKEWPLRSNAKQCGGVELGEGG